MTESTATSTNGPRRRIRVWMLRRPFFSLILVLVLSALSVRLVWGWHLSRQLAAKLDGLRGAGHPTTLSEVVFDPLPDADNASVVLMRAAGALKPGVDSPRSSVLEYPNYPPYGRAWEDLASASERAHGPAFQLARAARRLRRAQLRTELSANRIPTRELNDARNLANTLADGATYAHLKGDDAEAVERLLDVLHIGRSIRQDPLLISQLVGTGIDALAIEAAQPIAATLEVGPLGGTARPASAEQVRRLIARLMEGREAHASFARAMFVERAGALDFVTIEAEGAWAIRPLADRIKLRWLAGMEELVEASGAPDFAAARPVLARIGANWEPSRFRFRFGGTPARHVPRYSRWFENGGPNAFVSSIDQHYRHSADRRATAVSFAARLYRLDHGGWPERLGDLVPAYLPAVPTDPFLGGNQPLGYLLQRGALPDGGDRPLVYFDAGGATDAVIDSEPMYGWRNDRRPGRREPNRQYRDLALWLPTTRRFEEEQKRLAAEAVEDDPEEADAPGDDAEQDDDADGPAEE